jgi:hypothetical protein
LIPTPGDEGTPDSTDLYRHHHPPIKVSWLVTLAIIFLLVAAILMFLGHIGRLAWKVAKWIIIICIIPAIFSWIASLF